MEVQIYLQTEGKTGGQGRPQHILDVEEDILDTVNCLRITKSAMPYFQVTQFSLTTFKYGHPTL